MEITITMKLVEIVMEQKEQTDILVMVIWLKKPQWGNRRSIQ